MEDEISPAELKTKLDRKDDFILIDVREAQELEISKIDGARHIPLAEFLGGAYSELDPDREYVIMCRSGARSGQATDTMRAAGYENVRNLVGGINRWAKEIDTSLPTY